MILKFVTHFNIVHILESKLPDKKLLLISLIQYN